ncbi:MAG: hypothetical protein SWJ54_09380 [Cyanobacteriota bacterium]|nr:hypothetical protein [Cyanobacteriota bacterium]
MGRQAKLRAKLKQMRQQAQENSTSESPQIQQDSDPKNFVENLEEQGYKLSESVSSPELPDRDPKPQI